MTARIDLAGHRFGNLLVVEQVARAPIKWKCICDCGSEKIVTSAALTKGQTRSCGCFRRKVLATSGVKHGMHGTGAWLSWSDMIKRCTNPRADAYKHYGGRGIKVCERWLEFANFYADMGARPQGMSIERRDVDGNYEPSNCEWMPLSDQANNKRRTVRVVLGGKEMSLSVACKQLGLNYNRIRDRIKTLGWTFERAISEPKKVNGTLYATGD